MPTNRTPGVYVEEVSFLPSSVAEVETSIPIFIGYTERAAAGPSSVDFKPTPIRSHAEYEQYFGRPCAETINANVTRSGSVITAITVAAPRVKHNLAYSVKIFFDNGGNKCYVAAVGRYTATSDAVPFRVDDLLNGLTRAGCEDEPTLIVIPEAVWLSAIDYSSLIKEMLRQCGTLKDRFAILDVPGGATLQERPPNYSRSSFGTENLRYGAAYFPFLLTSFNYYVAEDESNVKVAINGSNGKPLGTLKQGESALYNAVKAELTKCHVTLPPSPAVAGVYAATDRLRGVWKAPANVGVNGVIKPCIALTSNEEAEMNIDTSEGKSINALRVFYGVTKVWGARTLAGNDNEWRYISVRRFFNMVEEAVKKSTQRAVFESNDARTWAKVCSTIESYLTQKWREGALQGATAKDAFFVRCGLGATMTAQDILEGRMNVEIGMAMVRPAEFIILRFSHTMRAS